MKQQTENRIASLMATAEAAGFIVDNGRDDGYSVGRWWDITDLPGAHGTFHILIIEDADGKGWGVSMDIGGAGSWVSLAAAEREVARIAAGYGVEAVAA